MRPRCGPAAAGTGPVRQPGTASKGLAANVLRIDLPSERGRSPRPIGPADAPEPVTGFVLASGVLSRAWPRAACSTRRVQCPGHLMQKKFIQSNIPNRSLKKPFHLVGSMWLPVRVCEVSGFSIAGATRASVVVTLIGT